MEKSKKLAMIGLIGSMILILFILSINTRPYLSVSQVRENPTIYDNQEIQVKGIVDDFDGDDFKLTEGGDRIKVKVDDVDVPDDLDEDMEVVVTGKYDASSNSLAATEILTQCS